MKNVETSEHWQLNKAKRMLVGYLKRDGYRFTGNQYQNMDKTKWSRECDIVRIACKSGTERPRYLWATKSRNVA